MRKLISLLLLPFWAFAQTEVVGYKRYQDDQAVLSATLARMQAEIDSLKGNPPTPPDTTKDCKEGPTIIAITNITQTGADVQFHGVDIFELKWSVPGYSGTIKPTSSIFHISYSLAPGSYSLIVSGVSCKGADSKGFNVPGTDPPKPPTTGAREIWMNTTGYGFDPSDPDGIHPDWKERINAVSNLNYNGVKFSGINGVMLHMLWYEYEYKEGEYRDDVVLKALNYCKAKGLKLSISFVPWRAYNDGFLQDTDIERSGAIDANGNYKIWFANGDLPETYRKVIPSMWSSAARAKLYNTVKHLAEFLATHKGWSDYISLSTMNTEEFQTVRDDASGYAVGYCLTTQRAWFTYSGETSPPRPANGDVISYYTMNLTGIGNKWYEFMTDGLAGFQTNFNKAVKDGGLRSGGMYAGVGVWTANRDNTYRLNKIFAGTDIVYSSEGDAQSNWRKLMATDLNMGTFTNSAAEFDPTDLNCAQQFPIMDKDITCVDNNLFKQYGSSLFRRGLEDMHLAMAWRPDLITQLTEGFWYFQENFVKTNKGMTGISQGNKIEFQFIRASQGQSYTDQWSSNGGGLEKQLPILLK